MKIINLLKAKINIYQVGDIIMRANNRNPSLDYGGTWILWGAGKVPVCVDTADTDFNTSEKTGGEKTHTLTTQEMPSHNHPVTGGVNGGTGTAYAGGSGNSIPNPVSGIYIGNTGGGQPHNNLQPYITCYMYKKTA